MEKEKLLQVRKTQKKRKPDFFRKDSFKISRLGKGRKKKLKWRMPTGRHNKVREKEKSYPTQPSIGYRSPKKVRGYVYGLKIKFVSNLKELNQLNKQEEIAIIRNVGLKKKKEILQKAKELGIKVYGLDIEQGISRIDKKVEAKKKIKEERENKKKAKIEKEEKKKQEEKKKEVKNETEKEKISENKEDKNIKSEEKIN